MSTSVTWNNSSRSIPAASETRWATLNAFLIDLANNAQTTNKQIMGIRTATSSPVAVVANTDFCVVTNLSVAGAVSVVLPAGVNGQIFAIVDGKGDAGTNTITITGTGGQTIAGSASQVINQDRGTMIVQWSTTEATWQILAGSSGGSGGGSSFPVRTALTSPVTVANSDFTVMTNLSVAGAVAVNLPAGTDGKLFAIVDAKGDASTNNITITPASGNINGASTYVINRSKSGVLIQYNTTETQWKVLAAFEDEFSYRDFSEVATPATPPAGTVRVYAKSDNKMYQKDDAGVETLIGGSSSGSGEINVISNPSAASDTTGWTAATNYTVSRDTSNSPLSPTISSCFAISTTTAAAESSTSGVYFPIATMPTGLRSKKLKVEFYCTIPATTDGVWRLSLYDATTRMALSTDSSAVTTLPGGFTGKFTAFFDTSSNDDYVVNFSQTTRTNANTLYVTSVIVGPGIQPQGSVVTEWQSYTPTTDGLGSPSVNTAHWRRVGDSVEVIGFAKAGTPAASPIKFSLPLSYTIDSTKVEGNQKSALGFFNNTAGTNNGIWIANIASVIISDSSDYNSVFVSRQNAAEPTSVTYNSPVNGSSLLSADSCMSYRFVAPVSQFAGSGTLNLAQNDVEYASVAGTWDAASTTTVYGPGGTLMGGTLAAARNKTITWQTPVQNTDRIQIWGSKDQVNWFPINGSQLGASSDTVIPVVNDAGSAVSGVAWRPGATAYETIVVFNQYMNQAADGAPSVDWPSSASYWVATKSKTGQAVGFGIVSETSAGLVPSANSSLDNASATRLGFKQYISGTTYNAGLSPTISGPAGWSTVRGVFIPYQIQDGGWRLRFSFSGTCTASSSIQPVINGITSKNVASANQSVTFSQSTSSSVNLSECYIQPSSATITSVFSGNVSTVAYSGDIELDSKPTWAY